MRLKIFVLLLIVVAALFPTVARPAPAAAQGDCVLVFSATLAVGAVTPEYPIVAGQVVQVIATHQSGGLISELDSFGPGGAEDNFLINPLANPAALTFVAPATGGYDTQADSTTPGFVLIEVYAGTGCAQGAGISDGRLCRWDHYAVYTYGDRIDVYGIWERKGYFVLRVTKEELAAVPGAAGINTLVKSSSDGLVQVFRLGDSATVQVVAGLDFVRFNGLPGSSVVCGHIELD